MRRSDAFPSKYMGKDDIGTGMTLTIGQVLQEGVESDGEMKQKAVMYFHEPDAKPWIINAGNWMTIEDAYGEESDDWHDKPIELFVDPSVMFGGKRVGGVRVRIPSGAGSKPATQQAPQSQSAEVVIAGSEVKGDWFKFDTDKGAFLTNDANLGNTIQSFGKTAAAFVYHLNPKGKQIVDTASPAAVAVVDDDEIPF